MVLASARNLGHAFGAQDVFAGISFEIQPRDRVALVGVNGAGKSTLLRILAREETADRGTVVLPTPDRVGYLPQEVNFPEGVTLQAYLEGAFDEVRLLEAELRTIEETLSGATTVDDETAEALLARHAYAQSKFEAANGYAYQHRIHETIAGLGIPDEHLDRHVATMSGGQRTRAGLARLLLVGADLLLLDEPTNHLDIDACEWLEQYLCSTLASIVVVSHDRHFLDAVATRTWEIADGEFETYSGNYTSFARQRAERQAKQSRDHASQQAQIARTEAFIRRYRAGVKARQARGRQKLLDRVVRVGPPRDPGKMKLAIQATLRAGDTVLAFENLAIAPDAPVGRGLRGQIPGMPFIHEAPSSARTLTPLATLPDVEVSRGDRIAIVGPNGAGKTTLLRAIMGEIVPVRGRIHIGYGIQIGYYAQAHEQLDPTGTVMSGIRAARAMAETEARTYLGRFLFTGDDVYKPVRALSGGERSRLALAQLALTTANVLILDEPTNHLDIYSREALEGVLDQFEGTVIFVSHDRFLIDGLATHIWEVSDATLIPHEGSWAAIRASRKAAIAADRKRGVGATSTGIAPDLANRGSATRATRSVASLRTNGTRETDEATPVLIDREAFVTGRSRPAEVGGDQSRGAKAVRRGSFGGRWRPDQVVGNATAPIRSPSLPDARDLRVARERTARLADEVTRLETELATVTCNLEAAARIGNSVAQLSSQHETLGTALQDAEERWLRMQARLEELEQLLPAR